MEVTKLYRAANKLIKTLALAKTSMFHGDDNIAILNYNEVANIFLERKSAYSQQSKPEQDSRSNQQKGFQKLSADETSSWKKGELSNENNTNTQKKEVGLSRNLAICYNNLACLYAKKHDYQRQGIYFTQSILIDQFLFSRNKRSESDSKNLAELQAKLACKYFNYGYSLYRQFLKNQKQSYKNLGVQNQIFELAQKWLESSRKNFERQELRVLGKSYLNSLDIFQEGQIISEDNRP
ncbi:hypothetical protein FGO68_gene11012 [Halteria grandinella]|uniref:Uncharacterized protein n=1 Tax=Halteria grandinella TaxID=5974 RepID=A0A8J8P4X3_HALGN|nr:hypothetical protein FGO68_gene11012 [Halteria grandinella]